MRTYPSKRGPWKERPFFSQVEVERLCRDELHKVDLLPAQPSPIRVERFIEKRFGVAPRYEDLPRGVLGFTKFSSNGVESVIVSRQLEEEATTPAERRLNATLAHEAGHGLLHAHLYVMGEPLAPLFEIDSGDSGPKILCRQETAQISGEKPRYDGRWWEVQANMVIGPLLLPADLVTQSIQHLLEDRGSFDRKALPGNQRRAAALHIADIFEVNPVVARIRLESLFPPHEEGQLTL